MKNREKMYKRLEFLRDFRGEFAISEMKSLGLISKVYDFRNLATDLWYLNTKCERRKLDLIKDCGDPIKSLWLGCIVIAISDVRDERPCDLGAWRYDSPPMGIETCSSTAHICAPAALGFLLSLPTWHEQICGLSPGTIRELVRRRQIIGR